MHHLRFSTSKFFLNIFKFSLTLFLLHSHLFEGKLKARKTGTYHLLYIERVLHEKQEKDKIESEFQLESVGVQLESTCEVNSVFPSEHLEKEEDLNEMDDS